MIFLKLFLCPLAVLAPGIFAGSETALTSLSASNLALLKERYPHLKILFEFWAKFPDKILTTIVLGNTLMTVLCGLLAASLGDDLADRWNLSQNWLIPTLALVMTILAFIFGEVFPKILGLRHSKKVAPYALLILVPLTKFFNPLVKFLVGVAKLFVMLLGIETKGEIPTLSAQEFKGMLEEAKDPSIGSQRHLLKNIVEFGRLRAREVQKSIDVMVAIEISSSQDEVFAVVSRTPYSRIPVYKGSLDNIMGIIYSRDLLTVWRTHGLVLIPDLLRPVYSISEEMKVSDLLHEFRKGHRHFALVRNLMGKVTGMITIEDVLEEIVGQVYDEYRLA